MTSLPVAQRSAAQCLHVDKVLQPIGVGRVARYNITPACSSRGNALLMTSDSHHALISFCSYSPASFKHALEVKTATCYRAAKRLMMWNACWTIS